MRLFKDIANSFNNAIVGIAKAIILERNVKIHFLVAVMIIILSFLLDITEIELLVLLLTISAVVVAEIFNTAIEKVCDLITEQYHQQIEIIKDISAGAVLITALNAIAVGYVIFSSKLNLTLNLFFKLRENIMHITFIAVVIVTIIVFISKLYFDKGTPLQGGMPSGHTATAFCLLIIIITIADNALVVGLSLILTLLVAQSRVESGIHKWEEVFWGAVLGLIIGMISLKLLYL